MDTITDTVIDWVSKQKIFFVSTAPLSPQGHVNNSPKGLDSFRILNENTVVYRDLVGSGIETIAHLKENGRITIMFCAFDGPPKIVRFYGQGEVITQEREEYENIHKLFTPNAGTRAYILIHVDRVADSCGYAVPLYDFVGDRDVMDKWINSKGEEGVKDYIKLNNATSIDGLEGIS